MSLNSSYRAVNRNLDTRRTHLVISTQLVIPKLANANTDYTTKGKAGENPTGRSRWRGRRGRRGGGEWGVGAHKQGKVTL